MKPHIFSISSSAYTWSPLICTVVTRSSSDSTRKPVPRSIISSTSTISTRRFNRLMGFFLGRSAGCLRSLGLPRSCGRGRWLEPGRGFPLVLLVLVLALAFAGFAFFFFLAWGSARCAFRSAWRWRAASVAVGLASANHSGLDCIPVDVDLMSSKPPRSRAGFLLALTAFPPFRQGTF